MKIFLSPIPQPKICKNLQTKSDLLPANEKGQRPSAKKISGISDENNSPGLAKQLNFFSSLFFYVKKPTQAIPEITLLPALSILLLLSILLSTNNVQAQGENNHWLFGNKVHVDFNSTPPAISASNMTSFEGCAAVSNAGGTLLFYSNGNNVWNAAATVMPNGSGLLGNQVTSSAQGVNIIQFPGNPDKYYLFVADATLMVPAPGNTQGTVRYSVIDMSLNGGSGDIVAGQKNLILGSGYSEEMAFARGPACNTAWFIIRDTTAQIHAYLVSPSGISPAPVVSNVTPMPFTARVGELKLSPDNNRIAWTSFSGGYFRIADFDRNTGTVSNVQTVTGLQSPYGIEFSPDNTKLYIATNAAVLQYDLSLLPNITSFLGSVYTVAGSFLSYMSLRLGPDQKIYIIKNSNNPIYAITSPNTAGVGCNLDANAIQTAAGTNPVIGLGAPPFIFNKYDTINGPVTVHAICFQDSVLVAAPDHYDGYQWSNGATEAAVYIHDNTELQVKLRSDTLCRIRIDSFKITLENFSVDIGPDTTLCPGDEILLQALTEGASCLWQDGQTGPAITVTEPGLYYVTVTRNACSYRDSILISKHASYLDLLEADTTICKGRSLTLHADAAEGSDFLWNTGESGPEITVSKEGLYTVTRSDICGTLTDSVKISTEGCDCNPWVPSAFSPNADGRNDVLQTYLGCTTFLHYWFAVYNRYGQKVFESYDAAKGWDGRMNNTPADAGTYFYILTFEKPDESGFRLKGDVTLIR